MGSGLVVRSREAALESPRERFGISENEESRRIRFRPRMASREAERSLKFLENEWDGFPLNGMGWVSPQ